MKKDFLKKHKEDFDKSRGALQEIISHNRSVDTMIMQDLEQFDFKRLEEHIEITKLILEGVKATNELNKQSVDILKNAESIPEAKAEKKSVLADIMKDLED